MIKKPLNYIVATFCLIAATGILSACTGRTADNMQPTGETVEVVIPNPDIEQDSVIANSPESDSLQIL